VFSFSKVSIAEAPDTKEVSTVEDIKALIRQKSAQYGVSEYEMTETIDCESSFNVRALGDNGNSRGLVQIHRPSWKDITDEQAYDPYFAVDFMAYQFSKGNQHLWSCYRLHFGG